MSELIQAQTDEMRTAARNFLNKKEEFVSMLSQINAQVQNLQSAWKGHANMAFTSLMDDWHREVTEMTNTLGQIGTNVNVGADTYHETDVSIARGFTPR